MCFFAHTFVYDISQCDAKSNKLITRGVTRAMVYEFLGQHTGGMQLCNVYIETMRYFHQDVWASRIYMLTGLRHNVHTKSKLCGDREFDGDIFNSQLTVSSPTSEPDPFSIYGWANYLPTRDDFTNVTFSLTKTVFSHRQNRTLIRNIHLFVE